MSTAAVVVADDAPEVAVLLDRLVDERPSARQGRTVVAVVALQAVGLCAWSTFLWSRFALTRDAGAYLHIAYRVANGHLDGAGLAIHFDLLLWPMALVTAVWPHGPILLWLQDLATVGAGWVAVSWIREMAERRVADGRLRAGAGRWVVGVCLVLVVAEPWLYWTDAFDVHPDVTVATLFAALAARALWRGQSARGVLWAGATLLNGDVAGLLVLGVGLSAVLGGLVDRDEGRRTIRSGAVVAGLGIGWELLLGHLGQTQASPLWAYRYLVGEGAVTLPAILEGLVRRPLAAVSMVWRHRLNLYASLAPAGLVGALEPWCLGVPLVVLGVDELAGPVRFGAPSFQTFPVVPFAVAGFGSVLVRWMGRGASGRRLAGVARRRLAGVVGRRFGRWPTMGLGALAGANALAWAAVWIPAVGGTWPEVSSAQAATLSRALRLIPPTAEVVAEQGVIGRFAQRPSYEELLSTGPYPVEGRSVWFVITPRVGIELMPQARADAVLGELGGPLHAQVVMDRDGVWVLRWPRPRGVHVLVLRPSVDRVLAWTSPGPEGVVRRSGPPRTWGLWGTGRPGYVATGMAWQVRTGLYEATVRLASEAPVDLEVWDSTTGALLGHRVIPPTLVPSERSVEVTVPPGAPTVLRRGWGPFSTEAGTGPERVEVRVLSGGGRAVRVDEVGLRRLSQGSLPGWRGALWTSPAAG